MVLPFDRTFRDDADPTLFPTIWETEMAGVLNRSIEGFSGNNKNINLRKSVTFVTPLSRTRIKYCDEHRDRLWQC
jgi:hypothetical protein